MIIFLSDIHLGWGDKADDFSNHAKRTFLRMRDRYPDSQIIIVGDLFDTDNHLERTLRNNHKLFKNLWHDTPGILPGNHDGNISWMNSFGYQIFPIEIVMTLGKQRTLITHGHQYDPYNKPDVSIGKTITRIVSFLERNVDQDIDIKLGKLRSWVDDSLWAYEVGLVAKAQDLQCSQIIYGHTHQPSVKTIYGIKIANCGTWTKRFERGYPVIVADGELELNWVEDNGLILRGL